MSDQEQAGRPKSTAEKLQRQREQAKVLGGIASEQVEEYAKALNSMAASPNGKLVFRRLINVLGVHAVERGSDLASLIRISERKNVYNELIRPFLETNVKQELER